MECINCTMKDCLWSDMVSPRAIAACMERRRTLGPYPTATQPGTKLLQLSFVPGWSGSMVYCWPLPLCIWKAGTGGVAVEGETRGGPILRFQSVSRELGGHRRY